MKKTITIFTVAAALMLTAAGCSKDGTKKTENAGPKPPQAQSKAINIKTSGVAGRTVDRSVEATGALMAWDEVVVSSEVPGTVEKISADLGDGVRAGQTLLVLDQREAGLNIGDAEALHQTNIKTLEKERARLSDAKTTFARYDELFRQGMVSASQYDSSKTQLDVSAAQVKEAEARVEQSVARLALARKKLSDTVIRSPISGQVRKRFVSTGEAVKDKSALFTVVSTGVLKFRGAVPESAAPMIKTGQPAVISVEAFRDRTFKGKITRISPSVDSETRTLEIEAAIPNPDGVLKPGFFAKGTVFTKKEENVPFVPESAVYSFVGITKIFVITGGKARERLVKTGVRQGDMVEVIDTIKPGEAVATANLSNLYDGADVKVTD